MDLGDFVAPKSATAMLLGPRYEVTFTRSMRRSSRWAHLAEESDFLELERGEDLDIIGPAIWKGQKATRRVLEQIKRLDGTITLRSKGALEALANFYEHLRANQQRDLFFRFSTTALPTK